MIRQTKLKWRRTSKDGWKSQTAAKRRYEIHRWETRGPGGRPTGVIGYHIARFAVGRSSGKWYVRYIHNVRLKSLQEAKAFAQGHANDAPWVRARMDEADATALRRIDDEFRAEFDLDRRAASDAILESVHAVQERARAFLEKHSHRLTEPPAARSTLH
ncbi:hypothetical protein [Bradyrhizobium cytisi]|uniref:Uncharacterized protein n=1 Tax=Bradyrhizobium cytisi TaxID=515489 RepID=A0A5S4X012_9BRAD|nr:hypothetical protein [Bradyrhizobium cytisi]TYL85720.1 hypothetical protein FXB38_09180 [Bradyrhizobium cytisi]